MKNRKYLCCLLTMILLLLITLTGAVSAATAEVVASGTYSGGLNWEITDDGTLTLSGCVDFRGNSEKQYPWEQYPDLVTRLVVEEGIDYINGFFFNEFPNLSSVQLPSTITEIPSFYYNTNLTTFTVHKEATKIVDYAFAGCVNLHTILFEEGSALESIGISAFEDTALRSVELPDSVKSIGDNAFFQCLSLTEVKLNNGLQTIGKEAFKSCNALRTLNIPKTVESVGRDALLYCVSLNDLRVDAPVTLGNLEYCESLKHVILGESVTWIPDYMFQNCGALEKITLEGKLTSVGVRAFHGTSLKDFAFAEGLISIGDGAFAGTALTDIVLPDSLTELSTNAFIGCKSLRSVDVGAGLETIGNVAFMNCSNLTTVDLRNVKHIGFEAFSGCASLSQVRWSERLEHISYQAFMDCTSLEEAIIPQTVQYMEHSVFKNCTGLKQIYFRGDAPTIEPYAFDNVTATAYYPVGNATWTEEVCQDYGAKSLAWQAYGEEIPGDINGDGKLNNRDATRLFQYLSGWDVEVNEAVLDVNNDGKVNNKDASHLFQYLSGWDVEIY